MPAQRRPAQSSSVKISAADIDKLRRHGAEAVAYYRDYGLAEVRSRATRIALSGLTPVFGWLVFGWAPVAMLLFMLTDALITLIVHLVRLPLIGAWMRESHARDHAAGELLGIADGLEDGTGMRNPRGNAPGPGVIVFFGSVSSLFMCVLTVAALEPLGQASVRAVIEEPWFAWLVLADLVLRLIGGLHGALRARREPPGSVMVFAESGGVAVLYAGLLVLVWLPLNWGQTGLALMFAALFLTRLAFGVFALWWTPRAVATLERRVATGDFAVSQR